MTQIISIVLFRNILCYLQVISYSILYLKSVLFYERWQKFKLFWFFVSAMCVREKPKVLKGAVALRFVANRCCYAPLPLFTIVFEFGNSFSNLLFLFKPKPELRLWRMSFCWQLSVYFCAVGRTSLLTSLGLGGGFFERLGNVLGSEAWTFVEYNYSISLISFIVNLF